MKNIKNMQTVLFVLAGILFFIAALIGKNYVFIPLGCCFIVLGIVTRKDKSKDNKEDDK